MILECTEKSRDFNILWINGNVDGFILRNLQPYQKVNHFPRSSEITRKDWLARNIIKMKEKHGNEFDIIPLSFKVPSELSEFEEECKKNPNSGPWIVKPTMLSRGRGIYLIKGPDELPKNEFNMVCKVRAKIKPEHWLQMCSSGAMICKVLQHCLQVART